MIIDKKNWKYEIVKNSVIVNFAINQFFLLDENLYIYVLSFENATLPFLYMKLEISSSRNSKNPYYFLLCIIRLLILPMCVSGYIIKQDSIMFSFESLT